MEEKPNNRYVDRILKSDSFEVLYHRFKYADYPSKELSESFGAMENLKTVCRIDDYTWLHIGDGTYTRTAAIFAFFSKSYNYSIDPKINIQKFTEWAFKYKVQNLMPLKTKFEKITDTFDSRKYSICCVHAHINLVDIDKKFPNWNYFYSNVCCYPERQTFPQCYMSENKIIKVLDYDDYSILSDKRRVVIYRKCK